MNNNDGYYVLYAQTEKQYDIYWIGRSSIDGTLVETYVASICDPDDISLIRFYYHHAKFIEPDYQSLLQQVASWWMNSSEEEKEKYRLMFSLNGEVYKW
jgi:hypothetical protein